MAREGQLHKLKRAELLELLLEVEQENELLAHKNAELQGKLSERELAITNAGSLADAAVQLSGVLSTAQETADLYLENVQRLCLEYADKTESLCEEAIQNTGLPQPRLRQQVLELFESTPAQGGDI